MLSTDSPTVRTVSAGARLDRLPISRFHTRVLWLIGGGMFLDSFDIYLAGGVLGALAKTGWSTMHLNAAFLSSTFIGMLIGAFTAGVLGDAKGRKFTYQFNLAVLGLASIAGAFAPNMTWLIVCRFFMGLGLGAEIVVGYGSVGEFMPPAVRGKWSAYLSLITNSALFFSTFLGYLIIPSIGWRAMFAIVGVGAMIVWVLRKKMPESPRWSNRKAVTTKPKRSCAQRRRSRRAIQRCRPSSMRRTPSPGKPRCWSSSGLRRSAARSCLSSCRLQSTW